jgi:hypothetical protein
VAALWSFSVDAPPGTFAHRIQCPVIETAHPVQQDVPDLAEFVQRVTQVARQGPVTGLAKTDASKGVLLPLYSRYFFGEVFDRRSLAEAVDDVQNRFHQSTAGLIRDWCPRCMSRLALLTDDPPDAPCQLPVGLVSVINYRLDQSLAQRLDVALESAEEANYRHRIQRKAYIARAGCGSPTQAPDLDRQRCPEGRGESQVHGAVAACSARGQHVAEYWL